MSNNLIDFTKMHGIGNDFMVINALSTPISLSVTLIARLASRHFGVGFDQLLIISKSSQADFYCQIFNSDGSEAAQCGNGLRCVARFIHENGLTPSKQFSIETKAGIFPIIIHDYSQIQVAMGTPVVQEKLIDMRLAQLSNIFPVTILSIGNPHAIVKVHSINMTSSQELAEEIATSPYFSNGANVGFMEVLSPHHVLLRTFERGAGETFACGSNACAAVVAGIVNQWLASPVKVSFKHGDLSLTWEGTSHPVLMTGAAERVYEGKIHLSP